MFRRRKPRKLVVKVQLSLDTNMPERQALIYNRDYTVIDMRPATPELVELMGSAVKRFFWAVVEDGKVSLKDPAPWQEW